MANSVATIRYIEDKDEKIVLPVTHVRGVVNSDGDNLETILGDKQDILSSGQNIKTINNNSILGPGNLNLQTEITVDDVPTEGSDNPVKSGGVYTALENIPSQDPIDIDSIPTENSENAVSSGGVYSAIETVNESIDAIKGIQSITSSQDGTIVITLSNGDAVTVDLNHTHPQYLKYAYLTDESELPASPDSTTLYLIRDNSND